MVECGNPQTIVCDPRCDSAGARAAGCDGARVPGRRGTRPHPILSLSSLAGDKISQDHHRGVEALPNMLLARLYDE